MFLQDVWQDLQSKGFLIAARPAQRAKNTRAFKFHFGHRTAEGINDELFEKELG